MKKSINLITTTVLSVGLLATTLTAYPQTLTQTLSYEPSAAEVVQNVAEEVKESDTNQQSQQAVTETTATPTTTLAPRPRVQTSQASRGGVQPSVSKPITSSTSSTSTSKATAIINTAKQYMGVKYVWGGTTPSGFDCSGYTQYVFAKHGISLPRVSRDQYNVGTSVSYANLKAGDLVFFSLDGDKVIDHVGIFIGNGQFINASSSKGVTIYTMGSYWQSKYIGAKRVL